MTGQGSGPLNIVGSAGGLHTEYHGFRRTAAQKAAQLGLQFRVGAEELFFLRGVHGVAQRAGGMRHNGDLGHRLAALLQSGDQSVTHFVIGNQPLFSIGQHGILLFCAGDDYLKGHQQIFLIHCLPALPHRPQRGFVDEVGKVSAHSAGGGLGQFAQIHILGQLDLPGMNFQGVQSALQIGLVNNDAPVKAAGSQQRFIQNFGPVCGCQDHDALGGVETVDLTQQGVQGLVVIAQTLVAPVTHRVDLIDEDDAGRHLGSLLEQVTDTVGAYAHEHIVKVGAGDGEEGNTCLAGYSLGDQGLTGTGGTHQQGTLGQLGTDVGVLAGVVQEVDDLLQAFLGLVLTGNVSEGNAGFFFHIHLGLGFADAAHHTVAAHPLGQHIHDKEQRAEHEQIQQDREDQGIVLDDLFTADDTHGVELFQQFHVVAVGQSREAGLLLICGLGSLFLGQVHDPVIGDLNFRQLSAFLGVQKVGEGDFLIVASGDGVIDKEDDQRDGQREQQRHPDP